MAPSDHDRRTDGPLQDIEDLLADARSGDENSQGADDPGQQLNAIRGQGGTATNPLQDVNNALGQSARPPPGSQVGTEASQMTIRDRGDAQYDEACSTGLHKPDVKTPSLPPHCPLSDRLMSLRVTSRPPKGPYFYPKGSVEALMTAKEIESIIRQGRQRLEGAGKRLTDEEIRNYAGRACHEQLDGGADSSYRVTFAILVLLDRGWDIVFFIDGGICDKHLPLKAVPVNGRGSGLLSEIRLENDPNTRLSCLDHWLAVNHDDFERKQWDMLAPFFSRGERRNAWLYELPEKVVLPWTEENNAARQGGYGLVSKVKIHPNHHTFNLTKANGGWFAVKQFKGSESSNGTSDTSGSFDRREFENEIEILRRFSGDVHPHLISLQAAFRHGDEYSVIMPWADCDLAEFWEETKPGSPLDRNNLLWMLEQCRGLAGGLQSIHLYKRTESATATNDPWPEKIFGRHGDIKPPNILLFRDQSNPEDKGKLVITDFGLSRFHSDGSKSCSSNTHIRATLTYRPPECALDGAVISRSFDIWSFGCVLLEFAAWYLGGWTLVTKFASHRTVDETHDCVDQFFEIVTPEKGKRQARIHRRVDQFVNDTLHSHSSCSEPIHQLLDFVMQDMLLAEPRGGHSRAECGQVRAKLTHLYNMVAHESYQVVASPRPRTIAPMPEAAEVPPTRSRRGSDVDGPSGR